MHFDAARDIFFGESGCCVLISLLTESLVAFHVPVLEAVVRRWSWSAEHHNPVLEEVTLGKRPVSVLL